MRHHVDGTAEIRRTDGRGGSGTAIEERLPDELPWEESPRVMRRRIRIVERNAVERHGVVAVLKTAEVRLAVAQARAVGAEN